MAWPLQHMVEMGIKWRSVFLQEQSSTCLPVAFSQLHGLLKKHMQSMCLWFRFVQLTSKIWVSYCHWTLAFIWLLKTGFGCNPFHNISCAICRWLARRFSYEVSLFKIFLVMTQVCEVVKVLVLTSTAITLVYDLQNVLIEMKLNFPGTDVQQFVSCSLFRQMMVTETLCHCIVEKKRMNSSLQNVSIKGLQCILNNKTTGHWEISDENEISPRVGFPFRARSMA